MGSDNGNKKMNDNKQQAPGVNKGQETKISNPSNDRDRGGQSKQATPQPDTNRDGRR